MISITAAVRKHLGRGLVDSPWPSSVRQRGERAVSVVETERTAGAALRHSCHPGY